MKNLKFLTILTLIITLVFVATLAACKGKNDKTDDDPTHGNGGSETTYTVEFDSNGVGEDVATVTAKSVAEIKLPTPSAEGYKFIGWQATAGDVTVDVTEENLAEVLAASPSLKLEAQWQKTFFHKEIEVKVKSKETKYNTDGTSRVESMMVTALAEVLLKDFDLDNPKGIVADVLLKEVSAGELFEDMFALYLRDGVAYFHVVTDAEDGDVLDGAVNLVTVVETFKGLLSELGIDFDAIVEEEAEFEMPESPEEAIAGILALVPEEYRPSPELVAEVKGFLESEEVSNLLATLLSAISLDISETKVTISINSLSIVNALTQVKALLTANDGALIGDALQVVYDVVTEYQDLLESMGADLELPAAEEVASYIPGLVAVVSETIDGIVAEITKAALSIQLSIDYTSLSNILVTLDFGVTTYRKVDNPLYDEETNPEVDPRIEVPSIEEVNVTVAIRDVEGSTPAEIDTTAFADLTETVLNSIMRAFAGEEEELEPQPE